ncbi:MAG: ATP-dependent helicase HrpB, partial [Sphingomonadales bacterium]|nr:ATP-dependent helicase HrpB [Sphingomonadales bacterium]
MADLPIVAALPELIAVLAARSNAVLVAPPGAGKTTLAAPVLLDTPWCDGEVLLLSPRRLAARAAAERIAELRGSRLGGEIGYATRLDSKRSADTRLTVMTQGIFRNRIIADPELAGVSAVLFDEVHERSLDGDFGLALALDTQAGLRPDLRLVAMSATLDGARFAALMAEAGQGDAPVIESAGRSHPLELRYDGRTGDDPIEDAMARSIRAALRGHDGDILAFLPGVREIERTAERLGGQGDAVSVMPLHGQCDPAAQRAAIRRDAQGRRKVVLATSIAETSLTIDGVRIVIDSGLARRPRFDRAAGVARLATEKVSLAAATQRAGRAARQAPGVAIRLWEEAATAGLPPYDPPEILESDLAPLLLDCAAAGIGDPATLRWIDAPPAAGVAEARKRLAAIGAIDAGGRITAHGRAIARLPLPPPVAHMVVAASAEGAGRLAADIAVLLAEPRLGGRDPDIERRLQRWRGDRGAQAQAARRLASRIAALAGTHDGGAVPSPAALVAIAYPDRVARRRSDDGTRWASAGGRGFTLPAGDPLGGAEWLAVADVQGSAAGARIVSAARLDGDDVARLLDGAQSVARVRYDPRSQRVAAVREKRLGAIRLSREPDTAPDADAIVRALRDHVGAAGLDVLPWNEAGRALRVRARFAGVEALADATLLATLDDWLLPVLSGKRRLRDIDSAALTGA